MGKEGKNGFWFLLFIKNAKIKLVSAVLKKKKNMQRKMSKG